MYAAHCSSGTFREYFFKGSIPSVASLWLSHLIEEIEHKNLAHDIYLHLGIADDLGILMSGRTATAHEERSAHLRLMENESSSGEYRTREQSIKGLSSVGPSKS